MYSKTVKTASWMYDQRIKTRLSFAVSFAIHACIYLLLSWSMKTFDANRPIEMIVTLVKQANASTGQSQKLKIESVTVKEQRANDSPLTLPKVLTNRDSQPKESATPKRASGQKRKHPQTQSLKAMYAGKLRQLIEEQKVYPRVSKKLKQTGQVLLKIKILKNGDIIGHELVKKTPFDKLNMAAMALVTGLKHFEPIPEELNFDSWEIFVPVEYNLR